MKTSPPAKALPNFRQWPSRLKITKIESENKGMHEECQGFGSKFQKLSRYLHSGFISLTGHLTPDPADAKLLID